MRYRPTRTEPAVLKVASGSGVAARKRLSLAVRTFAISAAYKKRCFLRSSARPATTPAGRAASERCPGAMSETLAPAGSAVEVSLSNALIYMYLA